MLPTGIGTGEMLALGVIALLLFGSKLPEVARNFGHGLAEFKKGMSGFQKEFNATMKPYRFDEPKKSSPQSAKSRPIAKESERKVSAPKFELPTSAPTPASSPADEPPSANSGE
jgi:sec-independent protein translocase protein TatA